MIRLSASRGASGGGDPELERRRSETEKQQARMVTVQNVFLFGLCVGIYRAVPWVLEQLNYA